LPVTSKHLLPQQPAARAEYCKRLIMTREIVAEVVQKREPNAVIHHLRMIRRTDQVFCIFDLEIPFGYRLEEEISLKLDIMVDVESIDEQILCAIRTTRNYVAGIAR
jgi:hypothetical protein